MLDREDDEMEVLNKSVSIEPRKSPEFELFEAVQSLKSVALLLKGLYGQINEEREVITMASGQMSHAVRLFEQHLIQFESFEKKCKQDVVDRVKIELKQSVQESAQLIAQEVTDLAYDPINRSINSLSQLSRDITDHHTKQKNSWRWFFILFGVSALLGSVVGGLMVQHLSSQTSKVMKTQLAAGDILMRSWNKLSKVEQEKIIKFGSNKIL